MVGPTTTKKSIRCVATHQTFVFVICRQEHFTSLSIVSSHFTRWRSIYLQGMADFEAIPEKVRRDTLAFRQGNYTIGNTFFCLPHLQ